MAKISEKSEKHSWCFTDNSHFRFSSDIISNYETIHTESEMSNLLSNNFCFVFQLRQPLYSHRLLASSGIINASDGSFAWVTCMGG